MSEPPPPPPPPPSGSGSPEPRELSGLPAVPAGKRPSGLRNPSRAVRGLGAATLALEALVLLLAIQPVRMLGGELTGPAIGVIVALALGAVALAAALRRPWAWYAATGLQGLLLLAGLLHWSLGALGLIFGLVWGYVLYVRRSILG